MSPNEIFIYKQRDITPHLTGSCAIEGTVVDLSQRDEDVPEYGGYTLDELRNPETRTRKEDVLTDKCHGALYESAVGRALYFSNSVGTRPCVHFPNAEHFQHFPFTKEQWEKYGDMESEDARIRFMLDTYPSRRFPSNFTHLVQTVLQSSDVLKAWISHAPQLRGLANVTYNGITAGMQIAKTAEDSGYHNGHAGAFQSKPQAYDTTDTMRIHETQLWNQALMQIVEELQNGRTDNLGSFLHLYNCVKDPITPLQSLLANQSIIFMELYSKCKDKISQNVSEEMFQRLVPQLALESSFLALPAASRNEVVAVVYGNHHELPYIYVDITQLSRGEFAHPAATKDVIFGNSDKKMPGILWDCHEQGIANITPLTVSYTQNPHQQRPELFIVDGNNRSTAVLCMRYLRYVEYDSQRVRIFDKDLSKFITVHNLDIEWERDLALLLQDLSSDQINQLLHDDNRPFVEEFATAHIPALLVQEPNFHTVSVQQSQGAHVELIPPMLQAVYNDPGEALAIPSKQQTHGRAPGNDLRISLLPKLNP